MSSKTATKKAPAKKAAAAAPKVSKVKKAVPETAVEVTAPVATHPEVETTTKTSKVPKKEKKVRQRREVSRETLDEAYESLQTKIEEEIQKLRAATEKVKGVKFLRSVNKTLKLLRNDTKRVLAKKIPSKRQKNTESGFMKPVPISQEMLTFTGWDASKKYSRVDVTKFICKYIEEHNLQQPGDRRNILANPPLCKLLDYDPKTAPADKPLTYFRVQQLIQKHFIKEVPVVDAVVDTEEEEA